jgi:hypothetical protein
MPVAPVFETLEAVRTGKVHANVKFFRASVKSGNFALLEYGQARRAA